MIYLTKPFSVEELLARLRVTQRRRGYERRRAGKRITGLSTNGKAADRLWSRLRLSGRESEMHFNADRVQAALPHGPERGRGPDPYLYITQKVWGAAGIMISPPAGILWQLS